MRAAEELVDRYCAAWNEPDAARRRAVLEAVLGPGARYTDPRTDVTGAAELSAHIGHVQAARPGALVVRTTPVDAHHGLARFGWHVALPGGGAALAGSLDVVELAPDGRLRRIVGFFGGLEVLPGAPPAGERSN